MALTLRRWFALALVLAALSAIVLLRPPAHRDAGVAIGRDSLWRSTLSASGDVSTAVQRLRAMELTDSVRRARPATDTTRLIVDPRLPTMIREPLRQLIPRSGVLSTTARHPTQIIIVRDMLDSLRGVDVTFGFLSGHYLLPVDSGESCTVLVRIRPLRPSRFSYQNWQASLERQASAAMFGGPCAWYEAFGKPGPHVQRWLDRGAWRLATHQPGAVDSTLWRPGEWGWYQSMSDDERLRHFTSLNGYRCATGDAERCAEEVLLAGRNSAYDEGRVRDMRLFNTYRWYDGLGPRRHQYLAAVAAAVGPERFGRLWQSDEPVADAFRRHVGEDLGAWTLRWARRNYGDAHARGPGISLSGALFGLVLATSALATALLKRRRRELA